MYLYVFTNNVNGMQYVGQSEKDPRLPGGRIHSHFSGNGGASELYKGLTDYGKDAFSVQVYHFPNWTTQAELDAGEKAFIAAIDCIDPNGYNKTDGGKRQYAVSENVNRLRVGRKRSVLSFFKSVWNFAPDIVVQYTVFKSSLNSIASAYGVSGSTIRKILLSKGIELRSGSESAYNRVPKKTCKAHQLSDEIVNFYTNDKISMSQLARRYKCSRTTIRNILANSAT